MTKADKTPPALPEVGEVWQRKRIRVRVASLGSARDHRWVSYTPVRDRNRTYQEPLEAFMACAVRVDDKERGR